MAMSDPLADMLTRVRNAGMVKFETVDIPLSKVKVNVAKILKEEGYINDYHIDKTGPQGTLRIDLKYDQNMTRVITGLRRISKPGRRIYVDADNIPKVMSGLGYWHYFHFQGSSCRPSGQEDAGRWRIPLRSLVIIDLRSK